MSNVIHPMYAGAIQEATVSNDLSKMKAMSAQAEEHLKNFGDVSAALAVLKVEIAKLEKQ